MSEVARERACAVAHRRECLLLRRLGPELYVEQWLASDRECLSDLHAMLYDHLRPDDPLDSEGDSDAFHDACAEIEAAIFELPPTHLNLRRVEGWRQEFGGGWDASWRMLLGPFRRMLSAERVTELETEARRTFVPDFLETWCIDGLP